MIIHKNITKALLGLVLLSTGCKEFIEPSIEKKNTVLLAPSNGTETNVYSQTFWWEELDNALQYRLQVVMPDFNNTSRLILDTIITASKFSYTLEPGNYEWRVRAENGSSQTPYSKAAFIINPSSIEQQQVQLQSPANNFVTNQSNAVFKWLKLFGADKYQLQIDTSNFEDETILFFNKSTPNQEFNVTLTRDKVYRWRVKAVNATVESKWSVIQNLTLDKTPPGVVFLTSPTNEQVVTKNVSMKWEALAEAKKYQLYIFKSDGTSSYGSFPIIITTSTYSFTEGKSGEKLFWQVRAIDEAGNFGAFSELRSFLIQ
ncbi:hypothetical protein [Pedobacter sp. B4-66]|uniref:hypothetical protein n=1 Tax=Pedobacter sp. B4-66 TaxID=2817280 RepID=UPI001BD92E65|nr:hypothetical protein [Pedobacter sp. B4-66]